jgi:hypothetical protein
LWDYLKKEMPGVSLVGDQGEYLFNNTDGFRYLTPIGATPTNERQSTFSIILMDLDSE